jgi:NAD(P)-dependent dehydrogenase (short-subunit alcohol dehydrogenase family)
MHDRTCVITGATSGIGLAAAKAIARAGFDMVLVARDEAKAAAVVDEIARAGGRARAKIADHASNDEVRRVGTELARELERVDLLVNNAGLIMGERVLTADGLETTFAVNHLAYFQLTAFLREKLEASAPARVVNVASDAHRSGTLEFDNLQGERSYSAWSAYCRSKLENLLFTYELARRLEGTGVTANCLHPGVVATGFGRSGGFLVRSLFRLGSPFFRSPEKGAETMIYLATSPDVERVSGRYFTDSRDVASSPESYDDEKAARLWELSERIVAEHANERIDKADTSGS